MAKRRCYHGPNESLRRFKQGTTAGKARCCCGLKEVLLQFKQYTNVVTMSGECGSALFQRQLHYTSSQIRTV